MCVYIYESFSYTTELTQPSKSAILQFFKKAQSLLRSNYCCSSVAKSCLTLCNSMDCRTPGLPVLHHLPELAQTHVHWVGDAIQPSQPLPSPSPPALKLSQNQGLFQWVSSFHQVTKVSFSISPSKEYSGLISFKMDWLALPAVQGTLKSLLQQHNSKAWIFQHLAFFVVQLSHPYMTTGKTIALTLWTVTCFFVICLCLPKIHIWKPNSQCDDTGRWGLWEIIRSWVQNPHEWNWRPL